MKKQIRLPITLEFKEYRGQSALQLIFTRDALRDWCVGLSLLKESMIEALIVSEMQSKKKAEIQVATELIRSQVELGSPTRIKIPPSALDHLMRFFLEYYRDGVAAVDHVDLQAVASGSKSKDAYIVFIVPDSAPPVSAEEAERRLRGR